MNNKLTPSRVRELIDTLNTIICDDDIISKEQRKNLVLCVATLGALGERFSSQNVKIQEDIIDKTPKKEKKPREPDLVFPNNGKSWTNEELDLIHSIVDDIPDDDIKFHIEWLSEKQGRTPYAIALKIVAEGRCDAEWAKTFKPMAAEIREQFKSKLDGV